MKFGGRGLFSAPCIALFACGGSSGGAASPTDPVDLPSAKTASPDAAEPSNDALSVRLVESPEGFVLDGAVGEWDLEQLDMLLEPDMPDEPREQEPLPTAFVGRVGLSLGIDGVLVAGELSKGAGDAAWIGVGTRPAALPYIGGLGRASASFDPVVCSEKERIFTDGMYVETDNPTPPETLAACKALVARYDAYAAERNTRFSKVFRFDEKGVTEVTGSKSIPVSAAKIAWKTSADGTKTFEAKLPIDAMPRVADAPLLGLRVVARARDIKIPAARWTGLALPLPLEFEPHAQLRSELFLQLPQYSIPYQAAPGLSFHPTKPNLVEVYDYGMETISPSEAELFVEHAVLGDVRIGKVDVGRSFLASYKGKEFVELYEPIHGWGATTTSQPIARDGSHHLFHFSERIYSGGMMYEPPGWAVTAIDKSGSFKPLLGVEMEMPPPPESGSMWWSFNDAKPISNKDFSEFGYRGVARENDGEQEVTIKWRWDGKQKGYVAGDWKMGPHRAGR